MVRNEGSSRVRSWIACMLTAGGFVCSAWAAPKIPIDDLPMQPVTEAVKASENWFVARFGMSWKELEERYTPAEVDRFLVRWRSKFPDDPEAWLSSANWNARQSRQETVHVSTDEAGIFVVDREPGKERASLKRPDGSGGAFITSSKGYQPGRIAEAKRLFDEAERKFPYRLDLYDEHGRMLFVIGDYGGQAIALRRMVDAVTVSGLAYEWTNYRKIGRDAKQVLLNTLHQASARLGEVESKEASDAQLEIALMATRAIPDNAIAWNDLTAAYDRQGNRDSGFRAARKAYQLAPTDEIVVINLAQYCVDFGLNDEAKRHFQWLVNNSKEPGFVEHAQEEIKRLGGSGRQ